jgi:hypothetical protein
MIQLEFTKKLINNECLKKEDKTSNSVVTQEKSCELLVVDLDNLKSKK